jgi:NlpC/P60 family putative phage cell wall peptidase
MPTRAEIVAAARSWIGTPYRHQAGCKGAGCDCLGLVRGVWRELYGAEPERPPPYSPDWGEAGAIEHMLDAASRHFIAIPLGAARAGDVILFRMREGRIAKHMAILTSDRSSGSDPRIVHALARRGVVEMSYAADWRSKAVAAFEFPGLV